MTAQSNTIAYLKDIFRFFNRSLHGWLQSADTTKNYFFQKPENG